MSNRGNVEILNTDEVLQRFHGGPTTGVFTDGSCEGNPGPGGWGFVWVEENDVVREDRGFDGATTNNRMELRALIEAFAALPESGHYTVYSDSQLAVNTITLWAAGWQERGWKRKTGPIKNLELVQELWALSKAKPEIELKWIKARVAAKLLRKKLGFRTVMDLIPLDTSLVRGSHGRIEASPAEGPLVISSKPIPNQDKGMGLADIRDLILSF